MLKVVSEFLSSGNCLGLLEVNIVHILFTENCFPFAFHSIHSCGGSAQRFRVSHRNSVQTTDSRRVPTQTADNVLHRNGRTRVGRT